MTTPILEVKQLKKYYPIVAGVFRRQVGDVKAVDDVSFKIAAGEILGLVGESGCGKTTIGRTVMHLIKPTSGTINFLGTNLTQLSESELRSTRKDMQIVFQDPYASLNPRKTIASNIGEALLYYDRVADKRQRDNKVVEILELIGLSSEILYHYPHEFSGGQQQRISIGRAIALNPKLVICDEAVSALDVSVQAQILNLLRDLRDTMGLSYLFISHDLSVVQHLCDNIVVLYLGKIMEIASTQELFKSPKHPYTQALLSAIPKQHPNEKKQRTILKGETPSPINPPSGCPFHPRCPKAQKICSLSPPPLKTPSPSHQYFCVL